MYSIEVFFIRWFYKTCINVYGVGCQNATAQNQSLRGERSSIGVQHSNLLLKYLARASTQVSEHEPRHMGAPQYRLNSQRQTSRLQLLHLFGSNAHISMAQELSALDVERSHLLCARAHPFTLRKIIPSDRARARLFARANRDAHVPYLHTPRDTCAYMLSF